MSARIQCQILHLRKIKYLRYSEDAPLKCSFARYECRCSPWEIRGPEAWFPTSAEAEYLSRLGQSLSKKIGADRFDWIGGAANVETMIETLYRDLCHSLVDSEKEPQNLELSADEEYCA